MDSFLSSLRIRIHIQAKDKMLFNKKDKKKVFTERANYCCIKFSLHKFSLDQSHALFFVALPFFFFSLLFLWGTFFFSAFQFSTFVPKKKKKQFRLPTDLDTEESSTLFKIRIRGISVHHCRPLLRWTWWINKHVFLEKRKFNFFTEGREIYFEPRWGVLRFIKCFSTTPLLRLLTGESSDSLEVFYSEGCLSPLPTWPLTPEVRVFHLAATMDGLRRWMNAPTSSEAWDVAWTVSGWSRFRKTYEH